MDNNSQPIDKESLNDLDSKGENDYVKASEVENDKGLWKVGDRFYPIEEMDRSFLQTAYYHALKKIGEHATSIQRSQKAVRKFLEKMHEIETEADDRDISEMIPVSPESAIQQILDPDANHHNQQEVNA